MTATKPPRGKHSIVRSDLTFAKVIFSSMEKCLLSIPSLNIEIFLPGFADLLNTEKALSVILGIFLSVAVAFFFSAYFPAKSIIHVPKDDRSYGLLFL